MSLSPIARIAPGGGPIQVTPAAVTASANAGFSDRKPNPGWIASAPVLCAAATIWSICR